MCLHFSFSAIKDAKGELPLNLQYFCLGNKPRNDVVDSVYLNPLIASSSPSEPPSGYTSKFNGEWFCLWCE